MILGLGCDLVDIRRIERLMKEYPEKFAERVFTHDEIAKAESRRTAGEQTVAASYAKRFAAKEAFVKALGSGEGLSWQEIEVTNDEAGRPKLTLHGAALALTDRLLQGREGRLHLTLSDEYPYAMAQVMIEAIIVR